jgi:hypothetical protein
MDLYRISHQIYVFATEISLIAVDFVKDIIENVDYEILNIVPW